MRARRLSLAAVAVFVSTLSLALAQELPLDAIVLETDAPDIPPHWLYRTAQERAAGAVSRNEPAELPRIAQVLAGLRGCSVHELSRLTRENTRAALPRLAALAAGVAD